MESRFINFSLTPAAGAGIDIRLSHEVRDDPLPNKIARIPFGRFCFGDSIWKAEEDSPGHRAGDIWLRVISFDGLAIEAWAPVIHMGETFGFLGAFEISAELDPETGGIRSRLSSFRTPPE